MELRQLWVDAPVLSSNHDDDYRIERGMSSYHPGGSVELYIVHSSDLSAQVVALRFQSPS